MAVYAFKEEDGDPVECTSCAYPAPVHEFPWPAFTKQDPDSKLFLCALCAATPAGNAPQYPEQFRNDYHVLQTVCHVGNAILDALGAFKREELKCSVCSRAISVCTQNPCVFRDLLAKGESNGT